MRIEHTRHTRHHQHIRTCLQHIILILSCGQIRTRSKLVISISATTVKRIVVVDKRHRITLQAMLTKTLKRLVCIQLAVRTGHNTFHRVFRLKIKDHRVRVTLLQMLFLTAYTLPQLRNRHIRLCRLVVHLQIPTVKTQGHVVTESVILHRVQQPLCISLRPVLHNLARVIQVTRSIEIISGIVRSTLRRRCSVTRRFRIRKTLVITADLFLRQSKRTVTSKIIRKEIAPTG